MRRGRSQEVATGQHVAKVPTLAVKVPALVEECAEIHEVKLAIRAKDESAKLGRQLCLHGSEELHVKTATDFIELGLAFFLAASKSIRSCQF